jgi:hypothetical protein
MPAPSATAIREYLRQSAEHETWTRKGFEKALSITAKDAETALAALQMAGYVEAAGKTGTYRNTPAGNTVAEVKASRPIKRATAERNFKEFLERIEKVNSDPEFLYRVKKAVLFGPYLSDEKQIKDVDLAVELVPKQRNAAKHEAAMKQQSDEAAADGKHFKNFKDREKFGLTKVNDFLRGRSRSIALKELQEWVTAQPHKVVFEA